MKVAGGPSFVIFVSVKPLNFTAMKGFIEVTTGNNAYKALVQVNTIQTVIEEGSVVCIYFSTGSKYIKTDQSYAQILNLIQNAL